ncbi:hypothetical protein Tco_0898019, partial [Tanacetum coccineum]
MTDSIMSSGRHDIMMLLRRWSTTLLSSRVHWDSGLSSPSVVGSHPHGWHGTSALSKFSPDTELVLYPLQDKLTSEDKSLDLSAFKLSRLFFSFLSSGSSSCWRSYGAQLRLRILKVIDAPTLPISAERNLGDPIEIRVDIVHLAPVDVFPAATVISALRFRIGMAEEENASLCGKIKTMEATNTITHRQEKRARMELERQLASVQESQRQDQE